ncbi:MAG: Rne/Rng family ribonuclease [Smithellaceae bacterium]|nr:Rne/Rng family ribonuclease [Smithellaceae bacterium]
MKHHMLINAVHKEQKRMATVNLEDGKLIEYNIQMTVKEPIGGNIYKGVVLKVERGLQAAFVNYSGKRDGFLPLRDVCPSCLSEAAGKGGRPTLKPGQEILVQVVREMSEKKGALLTGYISLPGRYMVLLPEKDSNGVSRKIENEEDRKRLKELVAQIKAEEGMGFIVRTAGMNRTKQELARDYQHLIRLWKEIQKKAATVTGPALIYQESDFGVRSLRDYLTSEIEEIIVDDTETFRKMRSYCKIVSPRNLKMIKLYKDKTPIFDKYKLEEQIRVIYLERVELKSGGSIIIKPTEALITIDVNSGRGSNKKNVEETAFRANMEAAEEIARQLRLRDLGGLIVIDFIDMMDRKHILEVEKTFKKAMSIDRARIQLSRISKFGLLELSRQKKYSTIQEISYTSCPYCEGTGLRPSLEYTALNAFRKIESEVVKGIYELARITLPQEAAEYLLNNKRSELSKMETTYDTAIHIAGVPHLGWDKVQIETTKRVPVQPAPIYDDVAGQMEEADADDAWSDTSEPETEAPEAGGAAPEPEPVKKKSRRRVRHRKRKSGDNKSPETLGEANVAEAGTEGAAPMEETDRGDTLSDAVKTETAAPVTETAAAEPEPEPVKKKPRRRPRYRKRKTPDNVSPETRGEAGAAATGTEGEDPQQAAALTDGPPPREGRDNHREKMEPDEKNKATVTE